MVKILWTDCEEHLSISVLYIFSYEIFYNSILYPSTGLVQESVNTKTMGSLSHSFYDLIKSAQIPVQFSVCYTSIKL